MSTVPLNDPDWDALISILKERVPDRSLPKLQVPLNIPRLIDHTLLSESARPEQIDALCAEAKEHNFATVCVRPNYVARAAANLKDTDIGVACVVGFPEGTHDTKVKVREAIEAVSQGATELDMVINYPKLKEGGYTAVYNDIMAVRGAAPSPTKLKAILETSQLNRDQLIAASIVACTARVDFIKTSTGFCGGGADVQSVKVMHIVAELCFSGCLVKASGGIKSAEDCLRMLKAGAMRIGTSSGVKIMQEVDEGELLEQGASHAVS
ncbi:Aldolase-type TIM barrel [Penicillium longicatenatum]|uniref:Aldolase-type TIM barrel n=1 Tax=Penicillium longicatenatum TaxID=1561947 RepID=UPI0025468F6B|nr:Aldolase-type TIM barrel [Penicillium longicatenatum]KAJ5639496.1 Aldolase-type TIM barrel [Penicillium longicatenatum]